MRFKEAACHDLMEAIKSVDNDKTCPNKSVGVRNQMIVSEMQKKGWKLTHTTLFETARSLGFTVVGTYIYPEV